MNKLLPHICEVCEGSTYVVEEIGNLFLPMPWRKGEHKEHEARGCPVCRPDALDNRTKRKIAQEIRIKKYLLEKKTKNMRNSK